MDPQNPQGNNPPPPPPPGNRPPPPPPRTPDQPDRHSKPQVPQYGQPPIPPQPTQPDQSDYRGPGGYSTHDQPTQAYGQGPQGGYQGYPPPPQQGDGRQYNVNAPKKGTPSWLWGVIGAVVVALIGGGVLLYFLLSPRSNAPVSSTTPQPTAAAGNPTAVPGRTITAPGQPTTTLPRATTSPGQPTTISLPTTSLPTRQVPTPGQGGIPGAAPDQVVTIFFDRILARDFAGALEAAEPDSTTTITPENLQASWESVEQQNGGKLESIEITDSAETGDSARVALSMHFEGGGIFNQIALLKNNGNAWVITGFNDVENSAVPTPEFATPEFPTPTEEPTDEGTEVVP